MKQRLSSAGGGPSRGHLCGGQCTHTRTLAQILLQKTALKITFMQTAQGPALQLVCGTSVRPGGPPTGTGSTTRPAGCPADHLQDPLPCEVGRGTSQNGSSMDGWVNTVC